METAEYWADGMKIFNLECHYCFTTILDRRPQSSYHWHSLKTHLHHLLLDTHQPHATPTIWRCLIWTFCYCTKCSFHPTVIINRWRLRKWFWSGSDHGWFTNSFMENCSHTPCLWHRTCILQPSAHYTSQYSYHATLQFTQTPTRPVLKCLSFSSNSDQDPDSTPVYSDNSDEEEEDFQMVPLDDEHWTSEQVPERTFCIHENGLPHNSCQYPCPYGTNDTVSYMDSLDLSDISDYEEYMVTSSDDELLGREEVPYWHWTLVCLTTYLKFWF